MELENDNMTSDLGKLDIEEQGRAPDDGDVSRGGSSNTSTSKRKQSQREPNSPEEPERDSALTPYAKNERTYYNDMDDDSPASYPKHVIVPSESQHDEKNAAYSMYVHHEAHPHAPADFSPDKPRHHSTSVLTPESSSRHGGGPPPSVYDGNHPGEYSVSSSRHQQYPDVYRAPSYQEMEYGRSYNPASAGSSEGYPAPPPQQGVPPGGDHFVRPRRWACDFCNVATFLSYEEACAHEEACSRRLHHHDTRGGYIDQHQQQQQQQQQQRTQSFGAPLPPPRGGMPPQHPSHHHHHGPPPQHQGGHQGTGLGALYHASQEVVTPPTPHHRQHQRNWPPRGPPLPVLPHEQGYGFRPGHYYDGREDPAYGSGGQYSGYYQHQPIQPYPQHPVDPYYQKRMLLAMPSDSDSLSDRQCYVRSEMVEIFAATDKDVAARHSKGAQKLVIGQVGIRCNHCAHIRPRDRAERAVCYPSSISRIYQTVADMQRFHFEQCREIPDHVRQIYKKLKTTRPRGVGSPQSYWVQSAKSLGLVDTEAGIRFDTDMAKQLHAQAPPQNSSEMSI